MNDCECEFCGSNEQISSIDGLYICKECENEPDTVAQASSGRGGWYHGKWLTKNEIAEAEQRWGIKSYESRTSDEYQCGGCKSFAAFGPDYGVCCNSLSSRDGHIMFEHGGCEQHSVLKATNDLVG